MPSTPERMGPAAAALMQLVTSRALAHDGDDELARQMGRVVARPTPNGWAVASGNGATIVASQAAMLAVQRAMTAPPPPSRVVRGLYGSLPLIAEHIEVERAARAYSAPFGLPTAAFMAEHHSEQRRKDHNN